ncbi:exonuclease 3'apos-5'apos domain-containing protein 1 [Triplophysa rosa]|uniref:Exonuclease 3'apos-5'apos domain-containing protein 1 n=1 Tax=Triplophysa rosa TaxID=992332 RepID=A0A9W7T2S0_TRIRA|nr:exonuclease 3'apos-5'apos domain-containing protein 1 [Triplophysa rosa]
MASSLEQCRFLECLKRKRVKITLLDTQVMGVIHRINLNKTVILEDVQSGKKFPGVKLFFGHDIVKVHANTEEEDAMGPNSYTKTPETHLPFFCKKGRCYTMVATKNIVYLFDILLLGGRAFRNGLCMILENQYILKVTHDCRCIARCLRARFGVSLTNVFDTQVADIMLFNKDTGGFLPDRVSTLQEVVRLHLKVPTSEMFPFWAQEQCTKENPEVWYIRPCPPALLTVMAVSVIHLLPLRLVLLDALMSDYTNLVDSYMGSYQNQSVNLLHFDRNGNELPKEARELEAVRQKRLKWATHCYIVSDDGLLERSSFKPSLHS